ncbi:MAG: ribonuclease Z [Deinococcales bacterium]|nr:ribonuclease Z [Chitinophagaceae bacterium]
MFGVTILGNNSAIPAHDRHPTAQVVTINEQLILIDCGEGTQMQMARYKIKRSKINFILISHLHGDHYFGLMGLLTSMGLLGRENELHLFAPPLLENIIASQLEAANTVLPYKLHFHALENDGLIWSDNKFTIHCFSTKHRVVCKGFIIREIKQPRKINKDTITKYPIPTAFYDRLKTGEDYETKEGDIIKNDWVTIPNKPACSYGFCADTIYDEALVPIVKNVSLLYHEATYLKDMNDRAALRFHSTSTQAATIAKMADVKKLIMGHFSSKYESLDIFLHEASTVFDRSDLAIEGVTFIISH